MAEIVKKLRCKLSFRPSLTEGITRVKARLHGGGGPQVSEVTRLAVVEKKTRLHTILQPRGAEVRFLEVVVALEIKEFEQRRPKLSSRER